MQRQAGQPGRIRCVHRLAALAVLALMLPACASETRTGRHLFILSGQSNMTGTLRDAFTQRVQELYGQDNAVVVMRMKSGRGIRFWVADYRVPSDREFSERAMAENGTEYKPLIEAATTAVQSQSFDTVGFVWMQGESDANNRLSEVYEESFLKLVKQLKKDLGRKDLYFVIGRIGDYARDRPDNEHWKRVREVQARLGETRGNAWIDTDDLNGGDAKNPHGGIHYPRDGAVALGKRFADKAIELVGEP